MKVAVDVLPIKEDGSAGGATGVTLELIKGFANVPSIKVMVLCAEWNINLLKKCLPQNVQLYRVDGSYYFTGIVRIDKLIGKVVNKLKKGNVLFRNKVDILYCPFSAASFKEREIPTVSTIHDIQHEYYPQFFEPQELQHRRLFYQNIVKKVERVVCVSDYTRETFCEKYNFPKERASTIYNAIQNRFSEEDDTVLDRLGIRNKPYIVYPANFWEHKNHKLLLNAFAMYAYEHKDLKLVLTGNPLSQTDYYDGLLKALNIHDLVIITNYISDNELYSILKYSKGVIYPSLFEGFGIPVVEAMHLHKLVASSNLTSLPEIGCEGIFYFNPKCPDEILQGIKYLAEQEITDEIIKGYDEKLEAYQTDKMVNEYVNVFEDVLKHKENMIFAEEVTGLFPDGWSSKKICIHLGNKQDYVLTGRLSIPGFLKAKTIVVIKHNGMRKKLQITPGSYVEFKEVIKQAKDAVTLEISKLWSPQIILQSPDSRKLGVMVESLVLQCDEKDPIDLKKV